MRDEYYDCYICPNNEILSYSTTAKNGYNNISPIPINVKNVLYGINVLLSKSDNASYMERI